MKRWLLWNEPGKLLGDLFPKTKKTKFHFEKQYIQISEISSRSYSLIVKSYIMKIYDARQALEWNNKKPVELVIARLSSRIGKWKNIQFPSFKNENKSNVGDTKWS